MGQLPIVATWPGRCHPREERQRGRSCGGEGVAFHPDAVRRDFPHRLEIRAAVSPEGLPEGSLSSLTLVSDTKKLFAMLFPWKFHSKVPEVVLCWKNSEPLSKDKLLKSEGEGEPHLLHGCFYILSLIILF